MADNSRFFFFLVPMCQIKQRCDMYINRNIMRNWMDTKLILSIAKTQKFEQHISAVSVITMLTCSQSNACMPNSMKAGMYNM